MPSVPWETRPTLAQSSLTPDTALLSLTSASGRSPHGLSPRGDSDTELGGSLNGASDYDSDSDPSDAMTLSSAGSMEGMMPLLNEALMEGDGSSQQPDLGVLAASAQAMHGPHGAQSNSALALPLPPVCVDHESATGEEFMATSHCLSDAQQTLHISARRTASGHEMQQGGDQRTPKGPGRSSSWGKGGSKDASKAVRSTARRWTVGALNAGRSVGTSVGSAAASVVGALRTRQFTSASQRSGAGTPHTVSSLHSGAFHHSASTPDVQHEPYSNRIPHAASTPNTAILHHTETLQEADEEHPSVPTSDNPFADSVFAASGPPSVAQLPESQEAAVSEPAVRTGNAQTVRGGGELEATGDSDSEDWQSTTSDACAHLRMQQEDSTDSTHIPDNVHLAVSTENPNGAYVQPSSADVDTIDEKVGATVKLPAAWQSESRVRSLESQRLSLEQWNVRTPSTGAVSAATSRVGSLPAADDAQQSDVDLSISASELARLKAQSVSLRGELPHIAVLPRTLSTSNSSSSTTSPKASRSGVTIMPGSNSTKHADALTAPLFRASQDADQPPTDIANVPATHISLVPSKGAAGGAAQSAADVHSAPAVPHTYANSAAPKADDGITGANIIDSASIRSQQFQDDLGESERATDGEQPALVTRAPEMVALKMEPCNLPWSRLGQSAKTQGASPNDASGAAGGGGHNQGPQVNGFSVPGLEPTVSRRLESPQSSLGRSHGGHVAGTTGTGHDEGEGLDARVHSMRVSTAHTTDSILSATNGACEVSAPQESYEV